MGQVDWNVRANPHRNGAGVLLGIRPEVHRDLPAPTVDTKADHEAVGQGLVDVLASTSSDATFAAACRAEWPQWFPPVDPPWLSALRVSVALCPP